MKQPMVPFSIRLETRLNNQVIRAAHRLGRDKSQIVRDALEAYFVAEKGKRSLVQRIIDEREERELTDLIEGGYYLLNLGKVVVSGLPAKASLFDRVLFAALGGELRQFNFELRALTRELSKIVVARKELDVLCDKSVENERSEDASRTE